MFRIPRSTLAALLITGAALPAAAQEAPESIRILFGLGETTVPPEQAAKLDQAARLFREGQPIVMIVSGGTDSTGPAELNLTVATERATSVLRGLTERGIAAERLQLLARGEAEPLVPTADDVDEPRNRVVEITWR